MPVIKVNNAAFYYEIHGQGHPLVLIAGYTCDHTFWLPILDNLSQFFQVIIFDNRAVGRTSDDGIPLSAEIMADDVYALCQELKIDKPHLIGQSMGGTIAQSYAAKYPQYMNKLAILTSSAKWRKVVENAFTNLLAMRESNINIELLMDATIPWLFGQDFLSYPRNIEVIKNVFLNNPYPQSLINQKRQFEAIKKFDGSSILTRILAKTLIVCGSQDLLSLPHESQFLAQHIKQSELISIDCAHSVVAEVPKKLTKVLVDFLRNS